MNIYEVQPIFSHPTHPFELTIDAPGSKSITNRALMLAALANGETLLKGALFSDDSRHFLQCLKDLGFDVVVDEPAHTVRVTGLGGRIPKETAAINVGSAGTAARFLTAMLGCAKGVWHLDASEQMKKRPMAALLNTLTDLGCRIDCHEKEGYFPFTIYSEGITASEATVDIGDSSQFLSALLMAAVMMDHDFAIHISGNHGFSYIHMTTAMMHQFGVEISVSDDQTWRIPGNAAYQSQDYQIEPDVSAACYFYAAAAMSGGSAKVKHVHWDSMQGDMKFLKLLEQMGCSLTEETDGIRLTGPADGLKGLEVNMNDFSDQALTLAAIAPYASSPVKITHVGHIRGQECDRLHAIVTNLTNAGITCEEGEDWVCIHPGKPQACQIETFDDHRVAMAFAVMGLGAEGIEILNPGCCKKTFENYFDVMDGLIE